MFIFGYHGLALKDKLSVDKYYHSIAFACIKINS